MYLLIFNDGSKIPCDWCSARDGVLNALIKGLTLQEAFLKCMNPDNTDRIVFDYGLSSETYLHYTEMYSIMVQDDGILIQMKEAA